MSRNGHNGSRAITCEHVVAHPNGYLVARKGIDSVRTSEYTCHAAVGNAFAFRALLGSVEVSLNVCLLCLCGELLYEFALRGKHHKGHTEDRIRTCGEDRKLHVAIFHRELHLRTLWTTNPVTLRFLQWICPVDCIESVEQALSISWYAQAPLLHLLLYNRVATAFAHTVYYLIVGQHRAELRTPIDHCLAEVSNAVVHQHLLLLYVAHLLPLLSGEVEFFALGVILSTLATFLFEVFDKFANRLRLLTLLTIEVVEHLFEGPLCPMVVLRIASAHLAVPVEREANLI